MASDKPIRVAIVGLGFGAEFIPIYQNYPGAEIYAISRRDKKGLDEVGDRYKIKTRYTNYRDLLKDPAIDAVHINSPIPDHAWMSVEALKAGKHVACTVPMGTSIEECRQIVDAQRESGKIYMMMETVVYSREYLFVKELYDKGELGRLQFLRGSHQQDMDGWPDYWPGLPPMWYATHCVSPCLAILGKHAESVTCHGSGRIREELINKYNSPFAVETATFTIKDSDIVAEVTRSLFDVARQYRESFDASGSKRASSGSKSRTRSRSSTPRARPSTRSPSRRSPSGLRYRTLPIACRSRFAASRSRRPSRTPSTCRSSREAATADLTRIWYTPSCAVKGDRPPLPDAETSANWTMVGLCAHESALRGGEKMFIPVL